MQQHHLTAFTFPASTFISSDPVQQYQLSRLKPEACHHDHPPRSSIHSKSSYDHDYLTNNNKITSPIHMQFPGGPGPSLKPKIGRPRISIEKDASKLNEPTKEVEKKKDSSGAKARPKRKTQTDEIPMYRVILLGDEDYDENHVCTSIEKVCELDTKEAQRIYMEAQQTGSALICVVAQEVAEFYAQQLKRQEIFVAVEKDE